jgi:hypothetical protein
MMKRKKDGLESKVLKIPKGLISYEDSKVRYIPWCDYFPHRGIIKDENVCQIRHCLHYKKLYIK